MTKGRKKGPIRRGGESDHYRAAIGKWFCLAGREEVKKRRGRAR